MPLERGRQSEWRPDPSRNDDSNAEVGPGKNLEGKTEATNFGELRAALGAYLGGGKVPAELRAILKRFPQIGPDGRINYLFTSGWAVEAVTRVEREHHDIDVVDMRSQWKGKGIGLDIVTPKNYWASMTFRRSFLEETAEPVYESGVGILVVHPAIMLVQKLSNAWGKDPRPKDWQDAQSLWTYLQRRREKVEEWRTISVHAVAALPNDAERKRTMSRLPQGYLPGPQATPFVRR